MSSFMINFAKDLKEQDPVDQLYCSIRNQAGQIFRMLGPESMEGGISQKIQGLAQLIQAQAEQMRTIPENQYTDLQGASESIKDKADKIMVLGQSMMKKNGIIIASPISAVAQMIKDSVDRINIRSDDDVPVILFSGMDQ